MNNQIQLNLFEQAVVSRQIRENAKRAKQVKKMKSSKAASIDKAVEEEIFKQQAKLRADILAKYNVQEAEVEEEEEDYAFEPPGCMSLFDGDELIGGFGRVSQVQILTAYHVLDDKFKTVVDDVIMYTMSVGAAHNPVDFILTVFDKKHDYAFLNHDVKAGIYGPITPPSAITTGGEVTIELDGKKHKSEIYPVKDSQFYAMANCPLEPGCSGLLAVMEGKAVAVFLGMQEKDRVGIFVQPRRNGGAGIIMREVVNLGRRTMFVDYEMYGRKSAAKGKGKRKHRAVKGGRISQAEYEAVSRAFYEQFGRWATWGEIDEILDYQIAEEDAFEEYEEDKQSLASFEDDGQYSDDFAAEAGDFWQNEEAEDREDARLAQRFDIGGGRFSGNEPFYTPFTKKKGKVVGKDKVVLVGQNPKDNYEKMRAALEEEDSDNEVAWVKTEEVPSLVSVKEVSSNPFDDDDVVEEAYTLAKAEQNAWVAVADKAGAHETKEMEEFRAWKAQQAEEKKVVSFAETVRVKEFDGRAPVNAAPKPLTPAELKEKADKLVAKLAERPDAPAKAFKEFSANERMDEVRRKIQVIEDSGVRLNYVVELTGDERMKFPVNEHPFQILQKQLRLLRSREVAISNEKQRRATAEKEIKRAQKLLETRNMEIAELTAKLEQLKQTTEESDF